LLQRGCELQRTHPNSENTPLHLAALNGHTDCVIALLGFGANREAVNKIGLTPRHLAIQAGHHDLAAIIQRYGLPPDSQLDSSPTTATAPSVSATPSVLTSSNGISASLQANVQRSGSGNNVHSTLASGTPPEIQFKLPFAAKSPNLTAYSQLETQKIAFEKQIENLKFQKHQAIDKGNIPASRQCKENIHQLEDQILSLEEQMLQLDEQTMEERAEEELARRDWGLSAGNSGKPAATAATNGTTAAASNTFVAAAAPQGKDRFGLTIAPATKDDDW